MRFMIDPAERGLTSPPLYWLASEESRKGSGKPTITPKTPFKVKDLHGGMRPHATIDPCLETVDNRGFLIDGDVESRRSKKTFPQYER